MEWMPEFPECKLKVATEKTFPEQGMPCGNALGSEFKNSKIPPVWSRRERYQNEAEIEAGIYKDM